MIYEIVPDPLILHAPALIVAIPLLGAFLTPLVSKINGSLRNIFVIFILAITGFFVTILADKIFTLGNPITYVFGGTKDVTLPVVRIFFTIDAMSMLMVVIGIILAFVAVVYSWNFMKEYTGLDKYYTLILLMTTGMFGMMLTGDMFNFFVFLEITSIASCALIAFWTHKGESVEAGFKYIVISAIGALFILLAIAILYGQYNALNIAVLSNAIETNALTSGFLFLDKIAFVLLIAALAMKAGLVPMHMWLPDAYGRAPSSVTLVLIGTTLASLYGVLRVVFTLYGGIFNSINVSISELVANTNAIGWFIVGLAILTILIGVIMALKQTDFKRLIGFAAVAEIGYMFLGIGIRLASKTVIYDTTVSPVVAKGIEWPTYAAIPAIEGTLTALHGSIFHIMNDALDVGLLFLVAGAVYYATKETSLNELGGLARNMKYTTIFFLIGLFAVSGIPPLNGFASKLIIYESAYHLNPVLSIIAILSSIMLLAVFVKVFHSVFLGPKLPKFNNVKEVPKSMLLAMGIIAVFIIFFGLFPNIILTNIVEPAANALANSANYVNAIVGGV